MHRILSGRVIFYLFLLLVVDLTIMPLLCIGPLYPQLLYLMVLYAAFQWGWQRTIPMALAVGILRDLTGSQFLGFETASFVLASMILDLLVQKMEREFVLLRFAAAFIFVFCASMFHLILVSLVTGTIYLSWYRCWVVFGSSLYTALLMPLFFYVTAKWFGDRAVLKQYELFQ